MSAKNKTKSAKKRKDRGGVYAKKGWLYYTLPETRIVNGKRKTVEVWKPARLKDTEDNRKKVKAMRAAKVSEYSVDEESTINKNILLSDFCDIYLEAKKREVADTTYATYLHNVDRIKKLLPDIKTRNLNEKTVENFLDKLFLSLNLAKRTAEDTRNELRRICDLAVKEEILGYNPVLKAKFTKSLVEEHTDNTPEEEKVFSLDESLRFLQYAKGYVKDHVNLGCHILYEIFFIMAFFGLRREEILGLKWSAINFDRKEMYITHTVTKGTKVNRKNTTKTNSSKREYPLVKILIKILKSIKSKELLNRERCGNAYFESDYIFKHDDGKLFDPDYLTKIFRNIRNLHDDLPKAVTLHGLRGTCVSILLDYCDDPKSVSVYVGHKEVKTTLEKYDKKKNMAAKEKLANIMATLLQYD